MAERADLEAAAEAGVLQREQVGPLAAFLEARQSSASPAPRKLGLDEGAAPSGEEELRFIRNFHDVFLAMGIGILAIGLGVGIATVIGKNDDSPAGVWTLLVGSAVSAALLLGLGEIFARRRRLFLPSIAICIAFAIYAAVAAACVYGLAVGLAMPEHSADVAYARGEGLRSFAAAVMVFAGGASLAALGFYLRFRLPFALGLAGGAAAGFVAAAFHALLPDIAERVQPGISLALGFALFAAAVAYDVRDPSRRTRYSDNGFWLHFAAAPLILGGVLGLVAQAFVMDAPTATSPVPSVATGVPHAVATLIVVAGLGFVSLLINRRALIVSALLTTGFAIGVIMNATGLGEGALIAATLVTLGGFVLVLGAGWHGARRVLLKQVRPDGVWARVFPPEADEEGVRA